MTPSDSARRAGVPNISPPSGAAVEGRRKCEILKKKTRIYTFELKKLIIGGNLIKSQKILIFICESGNRLGLLFRKQEQ